MTRPDENTIAEMAPLLEALCEDRLAPEQFAQLEALVLTSAEARWYYITYVDLHGALYWNAGGAGSAEALSSEQIPVWTEATSAVASSGPLLRHRPASRTLWIIASSIAAACVLFSFSLFWPQVSSKPGDIALTQQDRKSDPVEIEPLQLRQPAVRRHGGPVELTSQADRPGEARPSRATDPKPVIPAPPEPRREELDSREVVAAINKDIRRGWEVSAIEPSAVADDAEWFRRLCLDLYGRIPTIDEAEAFLANKRANKREEAIDQLLAETEFARNLTTIWTNLLIGRRSEQRVNRPALQKFLRMSFASNRPWNQIVYDLVAAEGNNVENGAANFLIAHLNNDALPATAVISRLFLAEQLQCNQCHNNPFNKSQQSAFWEMHSFLNQTVSVPRQSIDPKTGQARYSYTELVTNAAGGPVFYETQNGVMKVAFPQFHGQSIDPSPETNRRATLARLMTEGEQPQLAAAFVNRVWHHFFGTGFSPNPDEIGPHSPVTHPELLNLLARQFIRSGYDTKQLIRWICNSDPYQLTSKFGNQNQNDEPVEGQLPLFSRMYVRPMSPEQVYDSFVIATKAHQSGGVDWEQAESQRQRWLSQFVVDYNTDENEEGMELDGNLVQALTLMNSGLVDKALETKPGTYLGEVIRRRTEDKEKIRELCLAVLSRTPTSTELTNMRKLVRQDTAQLSARGLSRQAAESEGYQDLLWALLNSNEFTSIH